MTYLLFCFLLAILAPLALATWRWSLTGLTLQGLLMTWMVMQRSTAPTLSETVLLLDLAVLRTLVVPVYLSGILLARGAPARNDVIAPNLLSWTFAAGLVILAFNAGGTLNPTNTSVATHTSVAAAAVLIGLFVLASNSSPFTQLVAVLRIENGILLFELVADHGLDVPVQLGVSLAFAATLLTFGRLLRMLPSSPVAAPPSAP